MDADGTSSGTTTVPIRQTGAICAHFAICRRL